MIFTIRATSEAISAHWETSSRVARLFKNTNFFCGSLGRKAESYFFRPHKIIHSFLPAFDLRTQSYRKRDIIGRNLLVEVFFYPFCVVRKSAQFFSSQYRTKFYSEEFTRKLLGLNCSAKSKECQSSQYQSHINPLKFPPIKRAVRVLAMVRA